MPTPDLLTDEAVEYLETIRPWHIELEATLGRINALHEAYKADTSLGTDKDWVRALDDENAILMRMHGNLVEMDDIPPGWGWEVHHDGRITTAENFVNYAMNLSYGAMSADEEMLAEADRYLEGALAQTDGAAIYVEKWNRGIDPATLVTPISVKMTEIAEEKMPNTPVPTEPPATSTPIPLSRDDDFGVQKQTGSWGMKLYDVKRATGVYYSNDAEVPLGVWLLSFVEVTNLGTGTNSPWKDLDFYLLDDRGWSYDAGWNRACGYASLQFQVGHIMDDINPGLTLGVVMAVDVPGDMGDVWLRVEQDPDFAIYLGNASSIPLE